MQIGIFTIRFLLIFAGLRSSSAFATPAKGEAWAEIHSPTPAQLFVEGEFQMIELHFTVHDFDLSPGTRAALVYVIPHAISYGGDAFRGREHLRANPRATIYEKEARLVLDHESLDLGLHQVRVHLVDQRSGELLAESAAFFELRLPAQPLLSGLDLDEHPEIGGGVDAAIMAEAYDDKAWLDGEDDDRPVAQRFAAFMSDYAALHASILDPATPDAERRLLVLDQQAGGLGNRLGSVLSGLLLAMLSGRAMVVHWDLSSYLQDGDPERGGMRWQFASAEEMARVLGDAVLAGPHYTDMSEMAEFLVCKDYKTLHLEVPAVRITNPHYYLPLIASNPHYRRLVLKTFGSKPAHRLFHYLFKLAPYLQAKVDRVTAEFQGHVIGLQIRQARACGSITLETNHGLRSKTHAYLTLEHEELFYSCAHSLLRGVKGNASFFLATDLPGTTRAIAQAKLGARRLILADLPDEDVHATRAAMEAGLKTNFDGAFVDMWALSACHDIIATPASSFGYMATARAGNPPVTVSRWGKCLRPLSSEPVSHAWTLLPHVSCFDHRMLTPENDMLCQDCVVLECPCGDLTCSSHSENPHPLFPRQVSRVPG